MKNTYVKYYHSTDSAFNRRIMFEIAQKSGFAILFKSSEKTKFIRRVDSENDFLEADGYYYKKQ